MELSIVVPTFNERENVAMLIERLHGTLRDIDWEVIFVDDDSPDGTAAVVREIAASDPRVRVLQRIGRRGLASACVEGMLASTAPYLAVMDGDLQHDEALLPDMLQTLQSEALDLVVGSRFAAAGSTGDWEDRRIAISRAAARLSRMIVPPELQDPLSGYFMITRQALHACVRDLSSIGFKILLDLFASSPRPLRFKELPYRFRVRESGESKLDSSIAWDYLTLLIDKMIGRRVPIRFISFSLVGGSGIVVHLVAFMALYQMAGTGFVASQAGATAAAMLSNFTLNNRLTWRDKRLKGARWFRGLLSFSLACSIGALANVGVASYIFSAEAGWALATVSGVLVGVVWNYAVTSVFTWNRA